MTQHKKEQQAARRFKAFNGREPENVDIVKIKEYDTFLKIGPCLQIAYLADDGKSYRHTFKTRSRPLLCVSHDGKQLILLGGKYTFTEQGIVDN